MNKTSLETKLYGFNFTPKITKRTAKKMEEKKNEKFVTTQCFGAYFILLYARALEAVLPLPWMLL